MQENSQTFYHILPNGVKIVHRWTPSPVVYAGVMVGAGTRDEAPEENGMAHYIEHCVFKGTAHHSARQIIHSIEGIGGEINAYTTKEETTFYAAILAELFAEDMPIYMGNLEGEIQETNTKELVPFAFTGDAL